MRAAIVLCAAITLAGCNDLRDFRGDWRGPRVGAAAAVKVGMPESLTATLSIDTIDAHGLSGTIAIDKVIASSPLVTVEGAEADKLATMTFSGSPLRVYLAFAPITDGNGDALVMIALFDDDHVELRVLRGGPKPLYGIFDLSAT